MQTEEDFLKTLVRNTEERYIYYKWLIAEVSKDKVHFPSDNDLVIWFKGHLREMKNIEENSLKKLRQELTNIRQGLN